MVYDVLCAKVVYTCRKWLQAGCISNDKYSRCIVGAPSNLAATLPNTKHGCSLYSMTVASTSEQQAAFYLFQKTFTLFGSICCINSVNVH